MDLISYADSTNTRCLQPPFRVINIPGDGRFVFFGERLPEITFRWTVRLLPVDIQIPQVNYYFTAFKEVQSVTPTFDRFQLLPTSTMPPKGDTTSLTERELFLIQCIKSSKEKLNLDFEVVAQAANMSKGGAA